MAVSGDSAILKTMFFASVFILPELPSYWDMIAKFANQQNSSKLEIMTPQSAKLIVENHQVLDQEAFISDADLTTQLVTMEYEKTKQPLGIPLIAKETKCLLCGGRLSIRSDRPSRMTIYTQSIGTVPATHFHKYCQNYHKGCHFVQFYGYYRSGSGEMYYNNSWMTLQYFILSQETGFEMKMLKNFDTELLIGQISYHQKAEIYNVTHGYDNKPKKCSSLDKKSKAPCTSSIHG